MIVSSEISIRLERPLTGKDIIEFADELKMRKAQDLEVVVDVECREAARGISQSHVVTLKQKTVNIRARGEAKNPDRAYGFSPDAWCQTNGVTAEEYESGPQR